MKPVVYVDVLFCVNLFLNYIILWFGARFLSIQIKPLRLWISAAVGGLYASVMFFPQLRLCYSVLAKLLFSALLVWIAYRPKRRFFRALAVFYGVSFAFGGTMFGLFYFTNLGSRLGTVISNGIFYFHLPVGILIAASAASYILMSVFLRLVRGKKGKHFSEVTICYGGSCARVKALSDTGNSLHDPISGAPVMICELSALKKLFTKEQYQALETDNLQILCDMKFRFIPFHSLGKENGTILAFRPDYVKIGNETITEIMIGIVNSQLSRSSEYSALLHPAVG